MTSGMAASMSASKPRTNRGSIEPPLIDLWIAEGIHQDRHQCMHVAKRRALGRKAGPEAVRSKPREHLAALCFWRDDMDWYVPRRALSGHERRRLMIPDQNHDEVAVGVLPQIAGKRSVRVRDRRCVRRSEILPVRLFLPRVLDVVVLEWMTGQ